MTKTRITITLDDDIQEWVSVAAKDINRSQSEIVRICLREFKEANEYRFSRHDKARSPSENAWKTPENK
ncbi:CopG family transcriptional regulator [Roseibium sp. Sym1]|uniref:ribbon-helix-helix domain-containing protein n=1 Tax=Roseibium sp. Sym1 TaxID=3016006 RepID=UPI003FA71215